MEIKINGLSPDLISHPGETVFELMIAKSLTPLMLSRISKIDYGELIEFLKGKKLLSKDKYKNLSDALCIKESFFESLISLYLKNLEVSLKELEISEFEFEIASDLVNKKYKKYFPMHQTYLKLSLLDKIKLLREYFKVSSLDAFKDFLTLNSSFRSPKTKNKLTLEKIFLITSNIKVYKEPVRIMANFADEMFIKLKEATFIKTIEEVVYVVRKILRENGINFIYYHFDSNLKVQGFVSRIKDEIYLGVSDKGKYHDIFWFTLCHELGHLMLGTLTYDYAIFDDEETLADSLAQNILISDIEYKAFIEPKIFNADKILKFSEDINIAPGIIVGRLQKDELIPKSSYNYLRKKA